MEDFSARLRKAFEAKGVTPYEASKSTGITQATLSRLLSGGTKKPNIENLKALALYLQVSETWLRIGEGEMLRDSMADNCEPKTEYTLKCDEKTLSKFASAIESIALSNSTMSDTNKILAKSNAELIDQIRKLLASYERPKDVSYAKPEHKPLCASDKKAPFKP